MIEGKCGWCAERLSQPTTGKRITGLPIELLRSAFKRGRPSGESGTMRQILEATIVEEPIANYSVNSLAAALGVERHVAGRLRRDAEASLAAYQAENEALVERTLGPGNRTGRFRISCVGSQRCLPRGGHDPPEALHESFGKPSKPWGCRSKTLLPAPEPAGYCAGDVAGERGGCPHADQHGWRRPHWLAGVHVAGHRAPHVRRLPRPSPRVPRPRWRALTLGRHSRP